MLACMDPVATLLRAVARSRLLDDRSTRRWVSADGRVWRFQPADRVTVEVDVTMPMLPAEARAVLARVGALAKARAA